MRFAITPAGLNVGRLPPGQTGLGGINRIGRQHALGIILAAAVVVAVSGTEPVTAIAGSIQQSSSSPAVSPGAWSVLGQTTETNSRPTVLSLPNGDGLVLWHVSTGSKATYEYAQVGRYGGVTVPKKDMFAGPHWTLLAGDPTLVTYHGNPLLLFSGQQKQAQPIHWLRVA